MLLKKTGIESAGKKKIKKEELKKNSSAACKFPSKCKKYRVRNDNISDQLNVILAVVVAT